MKPLISVVMPIYNEAAHLRDVVASLLAQQLVSADLEVLLIDGMSNDGSHDIANALAKADARVRVFQNAQRTTPYAFNIGLREARGSYVAILGAHSQYAPDYLEVCLNELFRNKAVGCSGRVIPRVSDDTLQAHLALWVLSHPFGVSGSSFRTQPEGFADTIPYAVFVKQALLEAGGYDVKMTRNQDNDMNHKLVKAGGKLYLTWKTHCYYFTRRDLKGVMRYAQGNGSWCAVSFLTRPGSLGLRHYIPAVFALIVLNAIVWLVLAAMLGGWLVPAALVMAAPLVVHLLAGSLASLQMLMKTKHVAALLLPPIFFAFHFTYGFSFLTRLLDELRGKQEQPSAVVQSGRT